MKTRLSNFKFKYLTPAPGALGKFFGVAHATVDVTQYRWFRKPKTFTVEIFRDPLQPWHYKANLAKVNYEIYQLYDDIPAWQAWQRIVLERKNEYERWLRG